MSAAATAEVRGTGRSDEDLVASVRHGSDRAFEHLYERYHGRIFAYIVGMVRDHGRAEDLVQDAFMSSLRRMRETDRPIAFRPWIYEIARNACIDEFRRSRRGSSRCPLPAAPPPPLSAPASHGSSVSTDVSERAGHEVADALPDVESGSASEATPDAGSAAGRRRQDRSERRRGHHG